MKVQDLPQELKMSFSSHNRITVFASIARRLREAMTRLEKCLYEMKFHANPFNKQYMWKKIGESDDQR